ncbi:hypothetical protein [Polluticoccus soli]|uniref:hypothetical protein n=1 Tax=Polluticoccus soli TaxID=3034150 RepID=UPI0023E312AC|nr:hypothetical protein [Flavipsychrobacter sp. JY13-12]
MSLKNVLYVGLLGVAAFAAGCKKDKNDSPSDEVLIESDASGLGSRVHTSEAGVIVIDGSAGEQKKTTADTSSNEYPLELVASVSAPINGGDTLRATHVEINGNYAYISYNTEGAKYKGAIDVFNISTASTPTLVSSVVFTGIDINAIAYLDNKLFFAGAKDPGSSSYPAVVGYIQLQNGTPTSTVQTVHYTGYAGTGIIAADNKIYATTGNIGGLFIVDPANLQQTNAINIGDARSVAANSSVYAVQSGTGGVNIYNKSNNGYVKNISLGNDVAEAKRTMDFNGNYLLIANGLGGIKYYDVNSGAKVGEITLPTSLPNVVNSNDIVTNAVTFNNKLIFAANGAAGTYVCIENSNDHSLNLVGSFGFGIGNSINYVKSKDNYLFVAAGRGGMKIIKITPPSIAATCIGLPAYTGNTNMTISSNQQQQYGGSISLNSLTISSNSSLFYCGTMAIANNSEVKSNSMFQMQGSLAFGSSGKTFTVKSNATLKIQGNVTIYGNLDLNSNCTLEFVGTNNTITVNGNVTKGSGVTIKGTYTDTNNKL